MIFTVFADETEGLILSLFDQHSQQHLQKLRGFGMNDTGRLSAQKVVKRGLVGVVFALVYLACGYAVAEHLNNEPKRHLDRLDPSCCGLVIGPILKVMPVSSLVVHPRGRISVLFALLLVGTACALKIAHPCHKLGGAVLGQVMPKPLPKYTGLIAMLDNGVTVPSYRFEMLPRVAHADHFLCFYLQ